MNDLRFLSALEEIISARIEEDADASYTARLAQRGVLKVAQKVGEEGVELALAAAAQDEGRVTAEAADLLYHLLVLLRLRNLSLGAVVGELERRHAAAPATDGSD
ncbi:MAG: phosphoribosyl-ATP diphosphatase [Gammaproteobacteria bacterium]|nr:phosphoribosyl-ATP diphosphatase [Gammaproteobacteria bacterium]